MKARRIIAPVGNVIDFAKAKRKILAKRTAAARAETSAVDPFDAPLLAVWAAKQDAGMLAIFCTAVADGFGRGRTTGSIIASIRRDQVRQAARAAL